MAGGPDLVLRRALHCAAGPSHPCPRPPTRPPCGRYEEVTCPLVDLGLSTAAGDCYTCVAGWASGSDTVCRACVTPGATLVDGDTQCLLTVIDNW